MTTKNKKVPVSQDAFEAELKSEPQVFDGIAMGMVPRGDGGFRIVTVTLDTKSLEVGETTVVDTAESKAEAIEKFKINAIRLKVI